jgi:hypothetical protein
MILRNLIENLESFNIEIYKLKGVNENKFGDIAFAVSFPGYQKNFTGVSFIEAKRDFPEKEYRFDSFKVDQMKRFLGNTSSSFYLLYSHDLFFPVISTNFLNEIVESESIKDGKLKLDHISTPLITFVSQLNRYLCGYDLDFSKDAIEVAKGENAKKRPSYIVHMNGSSNGPSNEPTPSPSSPPPFKPNDRVYRKVMRNDQKSKQNDKKNDGPGPSSGGFSRGPSM